MEQTPRTFGADAENEVPPDSGDIENQPEEPATEEEQALYELIVARALKFMHGKAKNEVLQQLSNAESPHIGVGDAAAMIIAAIRTSAKSAGREIEDEIYFNAGVEVVEELMELAVAAGVYKFSSQEEEQSELNLALEQAVKAYGEMALQKGEVDQGPYQQIMDEQIKREQGAKVGGAVRQAMAEKPVPAGGEGIARSPGMISGAMGA